MQPTAESTDKTAEGTGKTAESKAPGEKRKRKAKDAPEKPKYPSVPTTAHIPSDCMFTHKTRLHLVLYPPWRTHQLTHFSLLVVALSSFFSLHRPISITRGLPRNITEDAFASIFATQTRSQKAAEVMSTISRTVDDLEQPMAGLSVQQQQQVGESADSHHHEGGRQKLDLRNADGREASVTVQVNNMSGQFLPFRPPPLPQPESAKSSTSAGAAAAEEHSMDEVTQQDAQTRVYKAVFTIEETTDGNGEVKIVAHSPELIEQEELELESGDGPSSGSAAPRGPRTFLERMALRQLRYNEAQPSQRRTMLAISVKRQRKLKMKKKKYKKLTKRLRHERLKHGRT